MTHLQYLMDSKIDLKPLLKHSFYQRWQEGKVTRPELQGYAKEYYQFESEFPCFVSAIHSKTTDAEMRQDLLTHLMDEEHGENNHPELWLRFAEGLGVQRSSVKDHFHSDETEHLLKNMRKHTRSANPIDGLAALYAYEKQQPEVVEKKIEGLRAFYGLTDDRSVEFFKVHETADVWHASSTLGMLEKLCRTEEDKKRAAKVVEETTIALYDFLDGVERRYAA